MSLTSRAQQQSNVPSAQPAGPGAAHSQSQATARSHLHQPLESRTDTGTGMFFSFTNYLENVTHTPLQQSPLRIILQL